MRKPKTPKVPGQLRRIVAANVELMAKVEFLGSPNIPLALAQAAGVSRSTIERVMGGVVGADLETLEKVAAGLGLIPYQLFIPNLDVKNPQVARGAMPGESRVYKASKARQS